MFVNFSKIYLTSLFIAFIIWNLSKETLGKNVKLHIFFLFFLRVRIYFYWSIIALQKLHKVLPYNSESESAVCMPMSPWAFLPTSTSHPTPRSSQSSGRSSQGDTGFHQLSISHTVVYTCQLPSVPPILPSPAASTCLFSASPSLFLSCPASRLISKNSRHLRNLCLVYFWVIKALGTIKYENKFIRKQIL